jgi:Flp pilus assembly protein TadD
MNNLAFLLAKRGDLDTALVYARRARLGAPEMAEVMDTLGYVYTAKRLTNLAVQTLVDAVEKAPENLTFREHLADALDQREDGSAAMKSLQAALRDHSTVKERVLELTRGLR